MEDTSAQTANPPCWVLGSNGGGVGGAIITMVEVTSEPTCTVDGGKAGSTDIVYSSGMICSTGATTYISASTKRKDTHT